MYGTAAPQPKMTYTASYAFFEALIEAGVTHCFLNLGCDHPSLIEAMIKGKREKPEKWLTFITCPNEMVAMSMADGYARLTGQPQAVIIHVDVGTQGLGAAVHNASTGRAPVFVFAGMSPFTQEGELRGSRGEFIHWMQDIPDQKLILGQYCRYTAEAKTGRNIKQMVCRAMQFATSDPQGPVYLCAAREPLEEEMEPYDLPEHSWGPAELGTLPAEGAEQIARALLGAEKPLVLTAFSGRRHEMPAELVKLADEIKGLRVADCGGSDMCFPADHPASLGTWFGVCPYTAEADVIIVLDCDVPWIPTRVKPREDAAIFQVDVDPLKSLMPVWYIAANRRYRANSLLAVRRVLSSVAELKAKTPASAEREKVLDARWVTMVDQHEAKLAKTAKLVAPAADGTFGVRHLCSKLKDICPDEVIWAVEAVTSTQFVHEVLQPTQPGSWINCGGGGLGWSGGGAMGIKLATDALAGGKGKGKFVCQIVGDGTFLFTVPGSVYWIAKRYNIPILTIVLNNKGWNAPRVSLELVHPSGMGSESSNMDINISFDPVHPEYSQIAKASAGGDLYAAKVDKAADLERVLREAVAAVESGKSAVLDCKINKGS